VIRVTICVPVPVLFYPSNVHALSDEGLYGHPWMIFRMTMNVVFNDCFETTLRTMDSNGGRGFRFVSFRFNARLYFSAAILLGIFLDGRGEAGDLDENVHD
jgi:hypothetical protein